MAYDLDFDYYPLKYLSEDWPENIQNLIRRAPPYRLYRFKPLNIIVVVYQYHFDGSLSLFASSEVNDETNAETLVIPEEYGFTLENDYAGNLIIRHTFVHQLESYDIPEGKLESFGSAWTNYVH